MSAAPEAQPAAGGRGRETGGWPKMMGLARGGGGESAEGQARGDLAFRPSFALRAPLTGRSGWRTESRRRGPTCWRQRRRAAEGERRCLAGRARNE